MFTDESGTPARTIGTVLDITERKKAEEALRQSERTASAMLNSSSEPVFLCDKDGKFLALNEGMAQRFNRSVDELVGTSLDDLLPPDVAKHRAKIKEDVFSTGRPVRFEDERDGRYFDNQFYPVLDGNNNVVSLAVFSLDITDLKEITEALAKSREALLAAQEIAHFGSVEHDFRTGKSRWSDEFHKIMGVSRQECEPTLENYLQYVHPEDVEPLKKAIASAVSQEGTARHEYRIIRPSGEVRTIYNQTRTFFDEVGNPLRQIGTSLDITEFNAATETAATANIRFEGILRAAPNPILGVDSRGRIILANDQAYQAFGYQPGELLGKSVEILVPETFKEVHQKHRGKYSATPHHRVMGPNLALLGQRKDGTTFPLEINLGPMQSEEGLITIAVVMDMTEHRQLEEQLLQAQKMESIGILAGGVAHDFNNILPGIMGYADLLSLQIPDDPKAQPDLSQIQELAERAAKLTEQLLFFSRQQSMDQKFLDLNAVVESTVSLLRPIIGADIELNLMPDPDLGTIRADEGQIGQVLMNLTTNARDAMPTGGTLTIETSNIRLDREYANTLNDVEPGAYILWKITDTGTGMDAATQEHIFDPFFTTKEVGKGTGLGLSTIHGIVKNHGGHIEVESEPEKGTTFKIYWPQVNEAG